MRRDVAAAALVIVGLAVGCGSDGGGAADAASAPDGADGPVIAAPVDIPWLTDGVPPTALTPCPEGWRAATDDGGVTTCDPYPEAGAADCPVGEVHYPGLPGCTSVGTPCPTDEFSEVLPADRRIVYVLPGATGGDGTRTAPHGSLADFSIGGLPFGTVVALSRGTHTEAVRLTRGLTLWGACAADTVVTVSTPDVGSGAVTMRGAAEVRDLRIADGARPGIWISGEHDIVIEGVVIGHNTHVGIISSGGARIVAHDLVVRDTQPLSAVSGLGLVLDSESAAELSQVVFERNYYGGVQLGAGSTLTLSDAVIRDSLPFPVSGIASPGMLVTNGATAEASRVLIERSTVGGVLVTEPGTAATLRDVVIRGTTLAPVGDFSAGLSVERGGAAQVTRALIEGNLLVGVLTKDPGSQLTLDDAVIRDHNDDELVMQGGRGVEITAEATVDLNRAVVEHNQEVGISIGRAGTNVSLADVLVRDNGGMFADERILTRGLSVTRGASLELHRAVFDGNWMAGIVTASGNPTVTGSDVVVRDPVLDRGYGWGLLAGGNVDLTRARFERNGEVSVWLGAASSAVLRDLVIDGTTLRECEDAACTENLWGHGLGSYGTARVRVERFEIIDSAVCGVHVAQNGELDLVDGVVRGNEIGACAQVDGYDVTRLADSVAYSDNGSNLESTSLPVPDIVGG